MSDKTLTCPSAPAEAGSVLLGVIADRGRMAYLAPNTPVTPKFLQNLANGSIPVENRLRFAGPCIQHECVQWKEGGGEGHCGLIQHAVTAIQRVSESEALPQCGIRGTCRWFAQKGRVACGVCPEIIRRPGNECRAADEAATG